MDLEKDLSASLHDPERVAAMRRTGLLDAPPDPVLDRPARLAARLLRCPGALIRLVAEDRRYCRYAVGAREDLVVEDARWQRLLRETPAVTEVGIVAYAGVPL